MSMCCSWEQPQKRLNLEMCRLTLTIMDLVKIVHEMMTQRSFCLRFFPEEILEVKVKKKVAHKIVTRDTRRQRPKSFSYKMKIPIIKCSISININDFWENHHLDCPIHTHRTFCV